MSWGRLLEQYVTPTGVHCCKIENPFTLGDECRRIGLGLG